jgi:hypothetical protein
LVRARSTQGLTTENLDLVETIKGPHDCWYIVNTRILHSVENVVYPRINLQISFEKNLPTSLEDSISK